MEAIAGDYCGVPGCGKLRSRTCNGGRSRWCHMHRHRLERQGELGPVGPMYMRGLPAAERFLRSFTEEDDHWMWQGVLDSYGYPVFYDGDKNVKAHRWAFERVYGEVLDGDPLHHDCEVRACVFPDHMIPKTPSEHSLFHWAIRREA